MKLTKVLMAVAVLATLIFVSCKPKDADIKAAIETAIKADPMLTGAMVDVKDGVATITGEMKDDACKALCEKTIGAIKGVKSVVNSCTVTPAVVVTPPASTEVLVTDPKLQDAVKAIIKDIPGITIGGFSDKGVILNGDISKANNMKLRQALAAAKIMVDAAASKLTVK
jgi:hyperosmotically inducible periplasmic protein